MARSNAKERLIAQDLIYAASALRAEAARAEAQAADAEQAASSEIYKRAGRTYRELAAKFDRIASLWREGHDAADM